MRLRDRVCLSIGGAALLTSVLVVGGTLRWTQAIIAGLVGLAFLCQVTTRRELQRTSPLVVFIGIAIALTAIQLVPLPQGILDRLDFVGNHLRADGAQLAHTHPLQTISLDPAQTLRALTFFTMLLGVAIIALRYAATERGRYGLLAAVSIVCGLAAVVTGVHTLVNADALYGIYEPQHMQAPDVFGPLLNPNHLGGLMAIGAVLSLGLAFYSRQPTQARVLWIVTGLGCTVVCAATMSRGAMVGLAIGFVVAITLVVSRRLSAPAGTRGRRGFRTDLPIMIVVGIGLVVVLWASAGNVVDQLNNTSLVELNQPSSKYAAWKSSLELIRESPWLGMGRGAVEAALPRVHPGSAFFTYSHLENEYLSTVVDWGLIGGVLMAGAFGWCLLVVFRRRNDGPLAAAAIGALAAILFQNVVDFGLELPGIAVPVVIIAATLQMVPLGGVRSPWWARTRRLGMVAALGLCAYALTLDATTSVQEDHDAIADTETPVRADLEAAIQRHPLDYLAFGEIATLLYDNNNTSALDYLNHALILHPTHMGLHRLAARLLIGFKRYPEAALQYSLAMDADPMPHALLTEIVMLLPTADDIAAAIPVDYPKIDVILHSLHDIDREDISIKYLTRVANQPQHDLRVMDTLYDIAVLKKDYATAKSTAQLRLAVANTVHSKLLLAKVEFERGELDILATSLADVPNWNGPINEKAEAWFILCDVHIAHRNWDASLSCLHRLDASGMLTMGREGINKRVEAINQQRQFETKMQAAEAIRKSLNTPTGRRDLDGPMPQITPATPPTPAAPTRGIPNPFDKLMTPSSSVAPH